MAETWTIKAKAGYRNPGFVAWHHGRVVAYGSSVEHVWAWLVSRGASPDQITVPKVTPAQGVSPSTATRAVRGG